MNFAGRAKYNGFLLGDFFRDSFRVEKKMANLFFEVSIHFHSSHPKQKKTFKATLHEAIFLATCLTTNVARQVARKISRVTPPATATKCMYMYIAVWTC